MMLKKAILALFLIITLTGCATNQNNTSDKNTTQKETKTSQTHQDLIKYVSKNKNKIKSFLKKYKNNVYTDDNEKRNNIFPYKNANFDSATNDQMAEALETYFKSLDNPNNVTLSKKDKEKVLIELKTIVEDYELTSVNLPQFMYDIYE